MARIYLPPSTPPPDDKPGRKAVAEPAAVTKPEAKPEQAERTVQLAEPAAAVPPPANASKADWVDYAVTYRGADKDAAEAMTRNALAEKYGQEGDRNG